MVRVTARKKSNGNELNGSWDELKWRATNETPSFSLGVFYSYNLGNMVKRKR
jgi:hypothetical protein